MKKRKILLGLALAAAAVFSLSACGDDKPTDNTPATSDKTGEGAGTGTGTGTGTGEGQGTTQSFDVKFMNGTTELTTLKQTVAKNGKVTKPARTALPTETGKRFDFWSADGGVTPYNFDDAVTGAVTLTAVFEDANDYDTLAASENKIFATDFYDETVTTVETSSFDATTITVTTTSADNKVTNAGKYHIEKNNLNVDFGDKKISTTGILTVYFETSFEAIKNGEAFFQVDGSSAAVENTEVFGLRVMGGSDNATKGKFAYRLDGGNDVVDAANPTVATNTLYKVKVVIDTADGKASIVINGTTLAENISTNISAVRGLKFTAKSAGESKKNVDNIAATFETKSANPLVTAKNQALDAIDTYKAGTEYTSASAVLKGFIDDEIEEVKTDINNATTEAAVASIVSDWTTFAQATKAAVPVKAYTAASQAATGIDDAYVFVVTGMTDATNITSQLEAINFTGYTIAGFYSDDTLATELQAANVTVSTTAIYASLQAATKVTLTYTPKAPAAGDTWESTGAFKEDYLDGKTTDKNDENFGPSSSGYIANTGEYDCLQLQVASGKTEADSTYLKTPTIADETKRVTVNMTGFTAGSGSASKWVKITAYDSTGTAITSVDVKTPAGKVYGDFTQDGGTKDIEIVSTTANISYLKITCTTAGKSFFIVNLTVSYEK